MSQETKQIIAFLVAVTFCLAVVFAADICEKKQETACISHVIQAGLSAKEANEVCK